MLLIDRATSTITASKSCDVRLPRHHPSCDVMGG